MPVNPRHLDRFSLDLGGSVQMDFVYIDAPTVAPDGFLMGSPEDEFGRLDNEEQRPVVLTSGYWMQTTPVTQAMWRAAVGGLTVPGHFEGPNRPVESVSWDEAVAFCEYLAASFLGYTVGLPTEEQWEFACRAGTAKATYAGGWQGADSARDVLGRIAWYQANSGGQTHDVAQKEPNSWGLFDMLGNVWEWCEERCGEPVRIFRGGSWHSDARLGRAASRNAYHSGNRPTTVGFRCRVQ